LQAQRDAARRYSASLLELRSDTPLPEALELYFRRVARARGQLRA
jgi:hypothetical protein